MALPPPDICLQELLVSLGGANGRWGAGQGLVIPYFRAMAAALASPKGWVPPPSSTDCQGWGRRAHSLEAPQGSHLGVGKQRRLGTKCGR